MPVPAASEPAVKATDAQPVRTVMEKASAASEASLAVLVSQAIVFELQVNQVRS
jgi:hypothetical protein